MPNPLPTTVWLRSHGAGRQWLRSTLRPPTLRGCRAEPGRNPHSASSLPAWHTSTWHPLGGSVPITSTQPPRGVRPHPRHMSSQQQSPERWSGAVPVWLVLPRGPLQILKGNNPRGPQTGTPVLVLLWELMAGGWRGRKPQCQSQCLPRGDAPRYPPRQPPVPCPAICLSQAGRGWGRAPWGQ